MDFPVEIINGKPVIKCKCERVPNANGGFDIIVHAPSLSLIKEQLPING